MDPWLRYLNGVQAMRRRCEGMVAAMGGALGVVAEPLPYQLATVRRIVCDTQVRHLIADEVGLGKTVQALMVMNALRWQNPEHHTVVVAPDRLLDQWQEESWIRGHIMPVLAFRVPGDSEADHDSARTVLVRPQDLDQVRNFDLNPSRFDLLVVDEPQTIPLNIVEKIANASRRFRQVIVLSATPRLGERRWHDLIMRMLEPEIAEEAGLTGETLSDVLDRREREQLDRLDADTFTEQEREAAYLVAARNRRVVRATRKDWSDMLPQRHNREILVRPMEGERMRFNIAREVLDSGGAIEDLRDRKWAGVRALQRSSRSARSVLAELAAGEGPLAGAAKEAYTRSLNDPGDSRFEALLDIFSEEWDKNPEAAFIVVCSDNPTIDMLKGALPRYFPQVTGEISVLRRPAATEAFSVGALREMRDKGEELLGTNRRVLLVGDWVQAGLNLHHFSHNIVFLSLPWDVEAIDQLIGRVDRLSPRAGRANGGKGDDVQIWRILPEGSPEAAISAVPEEAGVFDTPLPPLSEEDIEHVTSAMANAASGKEVNDRKKLRQIFGTSVVSGAVSRFEGCDPHSAGAAREFFENWRKTPSTEPDPVAGDNKGSHPVRRLEESMNAWLEIISRSQDYEIGPCRRDRQDPSISFRTLWYSRPARGPGKGPFALPDVSRENWMRDHRPFNSCRRDIPNPPKRLVHTDDGEATGRPLHFLDHGSELHDALVAGYIEQAGKRFGPDSPVEEILVRAPESHPACRFSGPVLLSVALIDTLPDSALPAPISHEAQAILAGATTERQKEDLMADRLALAEIHRAAQRWFRQLVPGYLDLRGTQFGAQGPMPLDKKAVLDCLRALVPLEKGLGCAKGKIPTQAFVPAPKLIRARQNHLSAFEADALKKANELRAASIQETEIRRGCLQAQFGRQIANRETLLKRRREEVPEQAELRDMHRGRVEALERNLEMAKLCRIEAQQFLQKVCTGMADPKKPEVISVCVRFVENPQGQGL